MRLVIVFDHDLTRDAYRHFLDASRRLASTVEKASACGYQLPLPVLHDLESAILDLEAARDAFQEAEIGAFNTPVVRGSK